MKKFIFTSVLFLMLSAVSFAQKQVTKFMGIPIDGSKSSMIQKLQAKGFKLVDTENSILTGEFNGSKVNLYVVTNNNKVCRIMLCDFNIMDEGEIKIRFNRLCRQFENNPRYISYAEKPQTIADGTDISYEINVKNKKLEALYHQKIDYSKMDSVAIKQLMRESLKEKSINDQLVQIKDSLGNSIDDGKYKKLENLLIDLAFENVVEELQIKMPVWFRIEQYGGQYYICMYYDNEYNKAHGEDL